MHITALHRRSILILLLAALFLMVVPALTQAQADATSALPAHYYLTADDAGIQQVWQQVMDTSTGEAQSRQITHAATEVLTYGVAYDMLAVAYISDGQLWLQPIHTETPEALAAVQSQRLFNPVIFSQDGQYIAYADQGVWLLDLSTRTTRLILEDVPIAADGSNVADLRLYQPLEFVVDADGIVSDLLVKVGVWEWQSAGIYNLATDQLQDITALDYTSVLPLSTGQVLIYGNTGVSGIPGLALADDPDNINQVNPVLDFTTLTDNTLYANRAVEIAPGVVRVVGLPQVLELPGDFGVFSLDYEVATGEVSNFKLIALIAAPDGYDTAVGQLSPDGAFLPFYRDVTYTDAAIPQGNVTVVDLTAGEPVELPLPEHIQQFQWQPE